MATKEHQMYFLRISSIVVNVFGIFLSIYAYHVEVSKEADENYSALCDINENVSCSKVFTSRYGKGFGLLDFLGTNCILNQPNSIYGMIFYSIHIIIGECRSVTATKVLIALGILANIGSVYLASILYFVLYDFCVVCVTTYFLNALLLIFSFVKLKLVKEMKSKKIK